MPTLSKEFRRQLENTVLKAREEAERGAAAALESFGVADAKAPAHLDDAGKVLRRKLRAHGRQVGDVRRPDESQEVERLVHECAYEHWHRMLFARFLAENGYLIEPESGLDVDLDFCEERARETKSDKWEVAAGFAQRMLPGIFRPDDPVLQLRLPAESRNRLTELLASLPRDVFLADDSLGWVYQFWQAKKKEDVNASGEKIGADELSPVTQLFTEDYMVEFLLHNTLGAWWAGRRLAAGDARNAEFKTEADVRRFCALPESPWKYLRFIRADTAGISPSSSENGEGRSEARAPARWQPAAGAFAGWPGTVKELLVLDPCMGSGHFLVFALAILVRMRMEEEGLPVADACAAVLRDNLFGLELDPRCTQIAAFNLALAAWKLGGHQILPPLNLACSGLGLHAKKEDWLKLAEHAAQMNVPAAETDLKATYEETLLSQKLKAGMERLYQLFQKAPVLGSLINPRSLGGDLLTAEFHELQPLLAQALERETGDEAHELAVTAQGVAKAAEILAGQFTLIATNVPYLGRSKQDDELKDYCGKVHPEAKAELAACFIERCLDFCASGASTCLVTPQSWLFLGTFKKLRQRLLKEAEVNYVVRLGPNAFQDMNWWAATTAIFSLTRQESLTSHAIVSLDVGDVHEPDDKADALAIREISWLTQRSQLENPDSRIALKEQKPFPLLELYADCYQGISPADFAHYGRMFWEINLNPEWRLWQSTVEGTMEFGGRVRALWWNKDFLDAVEAGSAYIRGEASWGKSGVVVSAMGGLPCTLYLGEASDTNTAIVVPKQMQDLAPIWCFCASDDYREAVRSIDQALKVTNATLVKIPFDLAHWQKVAAEKYPHGLPKPFSSDPTQWLFNGHPKGSDHPLQVAVVRLVGYRWPRQTGSSFPDCPALSSDGLVQHPDKDGVVCFNQVRDEAPAATRLRALLADAYGAEWNHAMECKLIAASGSKAESLEDWLLNDFFAQHCEIFHNRPFVWHIWDGLRHGFNVLVDYHKLAGPGGEGHRTLETLTYAYLGDWITRQKDALARGEAGADDRLAAALELQSELKKIVAGEPPYDLFIRWKPLHEQPIGWQPDINDGVRLNIRPFLAVDLSRGKKGCGLFRAKPGSSLKWDKDRGKEPHRPKDDFPWFWNDSGFSGDRVNDIHLTRQQKEKARANK